MGSFITTYCIEERFLLLQDTEVPEDFCLKLLQWYENNMNQFQHRPFHRRRGRVTVCDPNGCVDPGDIGNVCCPF